MEFTRRFWAIAAVGTFVTAYGALLETPVVIVGAAGIGGWLLARQWIFRRNLARVHAALTVETSVDRSTVAVDERTMVSVEASLSEPSPLSVGITPGLPVAATGGDALAVDLDVGDRTGKASAAVTWSVAGTYTFAAPTVDARDPYGLFEETVPVEPDEPPSVTVRTRTPSEIHVGAAGDPHAPPVGGHPGRKLVRGLDPAELREYLPGDSARLIDWRATARQNEPYVREFEGDIDQQTVLVVDHRGSTGDGIPGERKLDYLREVALGFMSTAGSLDAPFGCYTVGDEGVTGEFAPATAEDHVSRIRTHLEGVAPTGDPPGTGTPRRTVDPASARRAARLLEEDPTPFGRTLTPYLRSSGPYVRRVADDPLFRTVETYVRSVRGSVRTVVLTDDRNRQGVRETVKLAAAGDNSAVVFLTPTVLFDPGGLADPAAAYDRYVDFEEFRRELSALPGVTAFEVAPGDTLQALLASHRRRREVATGGQYG